MEYLPHAKKALGQHWLTDPATLEGIADAIAIEPNDTVLEVGPGPGTLTKVLAERAKEVVAIEFDESLAAKLTENAPANVRVIHQDILKFDWTSLPPDYKVVANIPYYLTANLLRVMSETPNQASAAALLVQKEVAERVASKPGGMSMVSVAAQYYWEVSTGILVPARLFTPPPKVDSQVLVLHRRNEPLFPDVNTKDFFRVINAGFANRRKTLLNSLSGGLHQDKQTVREILEAANLNPTARPQELSLDQWHDLFIQVETRKP